MTQPQIFQGTWEQFAGRAEEFRRYKNLLLIVPAEDSVITEPLLPNPRTVEPSLSVEAQKAARIEAIRAGMGKFAHLGPAVEELHSERQADKLKEEQQIEDLHL